MPYFVIGIFFCAFYLMNLVLAMVYLSYEQELSSDGNEVLLDIRKFNQHREAHSKSEPTRVSVVFCFSRAIPRNETLPSSLTCLTTVDELKQISLLFLPNVDSQLSKTAKATSKHSDEGPVLKNSPFSLSYQLVLSCSAEQFSSTLAALCSILYMYIPIDLSPEVVRRQ